MLYLKVTYLKPSCRQLLVLKTLVCCLLFILFYKYNMIIAYTKISGRDQEPFDPSLNPGKFVRIDCELQFILHFIYGKVRVGFDVSVLA